MYTRDVSFEEEIPTPHKILEIIGIRPVGNLRSANILVKTVSYINVITSQVCKLRAQKQSADASVEEERRNAERQVQFYLRKLDELRSYLSTGQ